MSFALAPPRESIEGTYHPKTLFWLPTQHDFEKTKTFDYRFDEVWSALTGILYELDLSIKSSDKASGIIALQEWTTTDTLIESRYCDCGRHSFKVRTYRGFERRPFEQIDEPRIASTTFYVRVRDSLRTDMKIVNKFHISFRTAEGLLEKPAKDLITGLTEFTYPDVWPCTSTGSLESWLFQAIERKLSAPKSVSPKDR